MVVFQRFFFVSQFRRRRTAGVRELYETFSYGLNIKLIGTTYGFILWYSLVFLMRLSLSPSFPPGFKRKR
jgi:hypothetical protein